MKAPNDYTYSWSVYHDRATDKDVLRLRIDAACGKNDTPDRSNFYGTIIRDFAGD